VLRKLPQADKCVYCGAETQLYIADDAVCVDCAKDIDARRNRGEGPKIKPQKNPPPSGAPIDS